MNSQYVPAKKKSVHDKQEKITLDEILEKINEKYTDGSIRKGGNA